MAASDVASAIRLIGTFLIQEGTSLYGVEDQVQGLQVKLQYLQQYLQDADSKREDQEVCALVCQVRKLVYDVEDVIDTHILKIQLRHGRVGRNWLVRSVDLVFKFPHIYELREQIKVLQASLIQVSEELKNHGVMIIANLERGHISREDGYQRRRPRSYPHDDNVGDLVVGMEDDIQKLVDMVMGEKNTRVGVISIVGMGGSGKTTLARKLFNHPYAKECFDCSAWVFISQEWSTQHILSVILRKLNGLQQTSLSVEELVDKIRCILEKKSYLVVLDDVWRKEALGEILPALPHGPSKNKGSKIIITTRNRTIVDLYATHRDRFYIHEPQPLTEESSWELFSKIALSDRKNYDNKSFENLGKDMLRKCNGLPSAIIALAGILNTRETIGEWHQVAETVKSRILEGTCGNMYHTVAELLSLSYDDLPYHLKPCFLYLSLFPEDCQISVGMLTRMWIAEGLIYTQYEDMSLEDVALQHVEDLRRRFMVQVVRTNFEGTIKAIRLHDLLRDLSVLKAKEQGFLQSFTPFSNSESSHLPTPTIQPRRAAVHFSTALPTQISYLRSLILLARSGISHSSSDFSETLDLHIVSQNFKLLRVLSICGVKMVSRVLPKHIGRLIHLRYLAIRATNITALPSSIGDLINLQTLDYRDILLENDLGAENVNIEIPDVFQKFVLLRHLFLPVEFSWSVQELSLSSLRNLRTLWGVRLDNSDSYFLREAPKLSNTLKKLKIVVSSENELKAAFCCSSLVNDVLHTFHCDLRDGLVLSGVAPLCALQHLLKLSLIGQIQIELSCLLPVNLVKLRLKDSMIKDANPMNPLGVLAHLKLLSLSNAYAGTFLSCGPGSFPQLEELILDGLPQLNRWEIKYGAMPCLKKLEITKCWQLEYYPLGLNFVTTLEQLELFDMPYAFRRQAAAFGRSPQKLRLPHNFTSIVKHSDSPVDTSSISKLYEQLIEGIFLENQTKKFWVMKQHGSYFNAFMVYASGLDMHFINSHGIKRSMKNCSEAIDSSEAVTVVKLKFFKSPQYYGDEAEYFGVDAKFESSVYFGVDAKFELGNLSVEVDYEINWIITFKNPEDPTRLDEIKNPFFFYPLLDRLKVLRSIHDKIDHVGDIYTRLDENLRHHESVFISQKREWIRIPGGDIKTDATMGGEVNVSLEFVKGRTELDLVILGFIFRPKP